MWIAKNGAGDGHMVKPSVHEHEARSPNAGPSKASSYLFFLVMIRTSLNTKR